MLGIDHVEAGEIVSGLEFGALLQRSGLVQIEALALKLHLHQIVALLQFCAHSSEYSRAFETLGSDERVSGIDGIVVVHGVLSLKVGILSLGAVHKIFILHQGIHAAPKLYILGRLDSRVHGSDIFIQPELSCTAYGRLRGIIQGLNSEFSPF